MLCLLLPLLTLAAALPTVTVQDAALKPYQLRGVQSPIFHLYLQSLPSAKGTPVMGPETTSEYFTIGSTIQSLNSSLFLNIGPGTGQSYLPLSLDTVSNTTAWGLEGDTVITTTASSYGRRKWSLLLDRELLETNGMNRIELLGMQFRHDRILYPLSAKGKRYAQRTDLQQLSDNTHTLPVLGKKKTWTEGWGLAKKMRGRMPL